MIGGLTIKYVMKQISVKVLTYKATLTYGRFHPGRELTAIELDNLWFAVKPIKLWIYLKTFFTFLYVSIRLGVPSSSILFTSFTCPKRPLNLAINENYIFWGTFERSLL